MLINVRETQNDKKRQRLAEPLRRLRDEARARLEANLKRIADDRNLTFAQRYQFNMLMSRFTSYRELWRRMLKKKGEELV